MKLWLRNLLDRVDALTLRERILMLLALLVVFGVLWDSLLMRPLDRSRQRRQDEVASLRAEVERLNLSIEELAGQDQNAADGGLHQQIEVARTGVSDVDKQLGGLTQGLIAPEEMVEVLKQVLARTAPLELISLRSLPAQPLSELMPGEALPSQVFRHGVELELEGGYLDLVAFLRALDALPWRFYWQDLELEVLDHPRLHVRLTAHTLGREEAWIGV